MGANSTRQIRLIGRKAEVRRGLQVAPRSGYPASVSHTQRIRPDSKSAPKGPQIGQSLRGKMGEGSEDEAAAKRARIVKELLDTEETYLKG